VPDVVLPATALVANIATRDLEPEASAADVVALAATSNDFAVRLFQALARDTDNTIVGAHPVSTLLLLTQPGLRGETAERWAEVLGIDPRDAAVQDAANALGLALEELDHDDLQLSLATSLFVRPGLPMVDEFLDTAMANYGAPARVVDFGVEPDALEAVNGWISDATDGNIPKLFDGFDPMTVLVAASAIHLDAVWDIKFVPGEGSFTTATGEQKIVPTMSHELALPIHAGADYVAVELPYAGERLTMLVVQPDDLVTFERDMTAASIASIADGVEMSGVHFFIPTWSAQTGGDILETLVEMGLPVAPDFSGMIEGGEAGYFIDQFQLESTITVNETGTEASAAAGYGVLGSHGPTIRVDRPFLYLIRDRVTGATLFLGHVVDPTLG